MRTEFSAVVNQTSVTILGEFSDNRLDRHTNIKVTPTNISDLGGDKRTFFEFYQGNNIRDEFLESRRSMVDDGIAIDLTKTGKLESL